MLYRISVTERGLTGIANIFRSRLSRLDDLLGAGTVPLKASTADFAFLLAFSHTPLHVFTCSCESTRLITCNSFYEVN